MILLLFGLSAAMLVMDSRKAPADESLRPEVQNESTSTATETTLPPEVITLDVSAQVVDADAYISASASVNDPGTIISLSCVLSDPSGETVYLDTVTGAEGRWEIVNRQGEFELTVSAMSASGATEQWSQSLSFSPGEFVWPVEPQYQMLLHDRYQVSSGSSEVGGYTHNNGLMREKHYVFADRRNHYGFDITAAPGSEVYAAASGKVLGIYQDTDATGSTGYGTYIIIRHTDKHKDMTVYTLYAHLSKVLTEAGQNVKQGQAVALSGNTGGSRIPHLHLEFRMGSNSKEGCVDPLELLPKRDFSLRRSILEPEKGFVTSSVQLHARMLAGGWDYAIPARTVKEISGSGITVPAGATVEITGRSGKTVKCIYNGSPFECRTSALEYTFDE